LTDEKLTEQEKAELRRFADLAFEAAMAKDVKLSKLAARKVR